MVQVTANPAMKENDQYQQTFERFEAQAKQPAWIFPLRKAGMARFAELGFPTLRHEDWRFTNVAPIAKLPFRPVFQMSRDGLGREAVAGFTFGKLAVNRLVFVERPLRGGTFLSRAAALGCGCRQPGCGAGERCGTRQGTFG